MGHEVTVLIPKRAGREDGLEPESGTDAKWRLLEVDPGPVFSWLFRRHQQRKAVGEISQKTRSSLGALLTWLKPYGLLSSVRLPDVFDFWVRPALRALQDESFDVVVSSFGPPAALRIGYCLKREGRCCRWVADFRDLWTKNPSFSGFPLVRLYESFLERKLLRKADMLTTVSEPLAFELKKLKPQVEIFHNGYDPESKVNDQVQLTCSEDDRALHIVYTGSLYWPYQNPLALFQVLRFRMGQQKRKILVHFYGPSFGPLEKLRDEMGLPEVVHFHGVISREEALGLQRKANALLFLESPNTPGREGILTGKLFEYLAAKRPILAVGVSDSSLAGKIISEASAGAAMDQDCKKIDEFLDRLEAGTLPAPLGLPSRFDRAKIAREMLAAIEKL